MKSSKLGAAFAALFMGAAVACTDQNAAQTPGSDFSVVKQNGQVALSATLAVCTNDAHLFTATGPVLAVQITETAQNPVTDQDLQTIRNAYLKVSAGTDEYYSIMIGAQTAGEIERKMRDGEYAYGDPTDINITPDLQRRLEAMNAKYAAEKMPPEEFERIMGETLAGNATSGYLGEGPGFKYTVSPAPVAACQPKP